MSAIAVIGAPVPATAADTIDPPSAPIQSALADPGRPSADRDSDHARRYATMLEFWGVRPGMTLLDFFGAHGITTEVLARTVGPTGRVYLQNPPWYYQRFTRARVEQRLGGGRLPNVVLVDSPFNAIALPPHSVDGIVVHLVFHDLFWMEPENVPAILNELSRILKPGGFVGVADHAAPEGAGTTLACRGCHHRIEEKTVRRMFENAGFVEDAESDALRNPSDDRTTTAFESPVFKGDTDRFLLRFRKL